MDLLNCAATFFVIVLHCTLTVFNYRQDDSWLLSLLLQSLFHWPVPTFIMISGANLLSYRLKYSTETFLFRRFKRVVIPFFVWSLIWLFYDFFRHIVPIEFSAVFVANLFLNNQIQDIFWFFYTIIGLYICTPILSQLCKKEHKKLILFFIVLCLVQISIIPTIYSLTHHYFPTLINFEIVGPYLSYYLTGWYITNFPPKRIQRQIIFIFGGISTLVIMWGTNAINMNRAGAFDRTLFDYNSIFVYLLSLSVFVLFQSIRWSDFLTARLTKLITVVSTTSFGVYIIHKFFILELGRLFNFNQTSVFYMIIYPIGLYILCVATILLLKKIPLVRKLIP